MKRAETEIETDNRKEKRCEDFFREMEEDMVFFGRKDRVSIRSWNQPSSQPSSTDNDDDERRW